MNTSSKLLERLGADNLVHPQDIGTADVTGTWIDVSKDGRFVILAKAGAVTAGKILTVQARQATNAAGAGAKDLGTAATAAGAGGNPPAEVELEFGPHDLDHANGFKFVTVQLGTDENGNLGSAWLIRGDRRYRP